MLGLKMLLEKVKILWQILTDFVADFVAEMKKPPHYQAVLKLNL
jgi:hypothetical protein